MAGYDNYSMSNNAVAAYDDELIPLSKLTKKMLTENNINITVGFAKFLGKCEDREHTHLKATVWDCTEWHHTSSRYNKTKFYNIEVLACLINGPKNRNDFESDDDFEEYECQVECYPLSSERLEDLHADFIGK